MAYKKKKYKINKKTPKAQEGIDLTEFAGYLGGGASLEGVGDWFQGVIDNIVGAAPNISFTGGKSEKTEGITLPGDRDRRKGSLDANTLRVNNPNFKGFSSPVPSGMFNLSQEELEERFGDAIDYQKFRDRMFKEDGTARPIMDRFASGRLPMSARMPGGPQVSDFNFAGRTERGRSATGTNTQPFDMAAYLLSQDPRILEKIMRNTHNKVKRKLESGSSIAKRFGLDESKPLSPSSRQFLSDIDEKALERELKRFQKNPERNRGPFYDLLLYRELLGNPNLTFQEADEIGELVKSDDFKMAAANTYPEYVSSDKKFAFDPGAIGGAFRTTVGDKSRDFDKFSKGTPESYKANLEASGIKTDISGRIRPNETWTYLQNQAMEGDRKGGGLTRFELENKLMTDENIFSNFVPSRGQFKYDNNIARLGEEGNQLFNFGVRYDKESNRHFSEGRNRFLTEQEEKIYRESVINKTIDDAGWKSALDTETKSPSPIGVDQVPSGKVDETLTLPGMPAFQDSLTDPIVENIQSISDPKQDSARQKKSIDSIVSSVKNKTHIKTGEEYNASDLKRDANIIRSEFGDDAYNTLMTSLTNLPPLKPASTISLVEEKDETPEEVKKKEPTIKIGGDKGESMSQSVMNAFEEDEESEEEEEQTNQEVSQPTGSTAASQASSPTPFMPFFDSDLNLGMPTYRDGGFGKKFNMKNMKFANGGTFATPVARAFGGGSGGGVGVSGGFDIPSIYESNREKETVKSGEMYLSVKVLRLENEIDKFKQSMDVNSDQDNARLVALETELNESRAELASLMGSSRAMSQNEL